MFKLFITGDLGFEFWMDIPGYEKRYQSSTYGRIRSHRTGRLQGKVLKTYSQNGYPAVNLGLNNCQYVHRLVAKTFLPKNGRTYVDHLDTDKENCSVWNLRWCTAKENCNNEITSGNRKNAHKWRMKKVYAYDEKCNLIGIYESINEASRQTGYSASYVSMSLKNKGLYWKKILFRFEPIRTTYPEL